MALWNLNPLTVGDNTDVDQTLCELYEIGVKS